VVPFKLVLRTRLPTAAVRYIVLPLGVTTASVMTHGLCVSADRELDDVEMHVTRIKPEGLDVLCRDTKFTRKELQIMYRGFKQVFLVDSKFTTVRFANGCRQTYRLRIEVKPKLRNVI